nr:hypothetical protein [Bacillus wiedmannii]
MNALNIYEYQQNRKRFNGEGRAIGGNVAQQAAGERVLRDKLNKD